MSAQIPLPFLPLSVEKATALQQLVEGLDVQALSWVAGYTAALASTNSPSNPVAGASTLPAPAAEAQAQLTVLYGSQTGNAKRLAGQYSQQVQNAGLGVTLQNIADYNPRLLKKENTLLIVISTQGDGEAPDDALAFMDFLHSKRAPGLPALHYAVLALGDSSYPDFCTIGKQVDTRLAELGATRLHDRGDCDLDIETVAEPWWQAVFPVTRQRLTADKKAATITPLHAVTPKTTSHFDRDKPFSAPVMLNQRITGRNTAKDVRHLELSLEGSGLDYQPGDTLGVWHHNPAILVDTVLDALQLSGDELLPEQNTSLRTVLTENREITGLSRPFLIAHAERGKHTDLTEQLAARQGLTALLNDYQLIDILCRWQAEWDAPSLISALRPLTPRLYSLASSRTAVEDEAHLTVARVSYKAFGTPHLGAASNWLAARDDDAATPVYIESNPRFHLPENTGQDIIMIGPGTGIAPFRGFVQERAATGATGRNWLFFGAQHFESQFLYQTEWQQALKAGTLHRIDLAFSRDQAQKIYVQQRLLEQGRDVFDWLENGARLYVCGGITMEKAVRKTLADIVSRHGRQDAASAQAYVSQLQHENRYSRDVY